MNIEIANIKTIKRTPDGLFPYNCSYVGRKNKRYGVLESPLANPFIIGKDGNRSEVIEKYRAWLDEKLALERSPQKLELLVLVLRAGLVNTMDESPYYLVCWCSPEACHAEVIREKMEEIWAESERAVLHDQE